MKLILTNTRLFVAGADLTGSTNKVEVMAEKPEVVVTTFGSGGWEELLAGIGAASFAVEGFFEAGDPTMPDDAAWAALGEVEAWTVCPVDGSAGAVAFFTKALEGNYMPLQGGVGDAASFTAAAKSSWPFVRGVVGQPPGSPITADGNASGYQLGAVPNGKSLYASLHVLSVAGTGTPTLSVSVESDDNASFTSAIERIAFDDATAVGAQIARLTAPLTDDYYRVSWTVTGTSPSFLAIVALGIA